MGNNRAQTIGGKAPSSYTQPVTFIDTIHDVIHGGGRKQAIFDGLIYTLIALSVLILGLDVALGESHPMVVALEVTDTILLTIFAVELILRILSYRPPALDFYAPGTTPRASAHVTGRLYFCLEPLILVDLITVLAVVPALRGLRAIRLLRLLRAARFFRYSSPFAGLSRAFSDNRLLYAVSFSLLGSATFIGGITIYLVERGTNPDIAHLSDGLWWALVTITTVGFGDIAPVSGLGRLVAGLLMVSGMITLGLFAGIVTQTLPSAILSIREEQIRMSAYMNHIIVCGYEPGSVLFSAALVNELGDRETTVVLFGPGERPEGTPPEFIWVSGDPTKESELDKLRLGHSAGVILIGPRSTSPQQADATTILTAFTLRSYMDAHAQDIQRAKPWFMVAEVLDAENAAHLRTAGATEVIETTRLGFDLLAHAVSMPGTARLMSIVASRESQSLYIGRRPSDVEGTIAFDELSAMLKTRTGALLIGIRDPESGHEHLNPASDFPMETGTLLVYLAKEPVLEPV